MFCGLWILERDDLLILLSMETTGCSVWEKIGVGWRGVNVVTAVVVALYATFSPCSLLHCIRSHPLFFPLFHGFSMTSP